MNRSILRHTPCRVCNTRTRLLSCKTWKLNIKSCSSSICVCIRNTTWGLEQKLIQKRNRVSITELIQGTSIQLYVSENVRFLLTDLLSFSSTALVVLSFPLPHVHPVGNNQEDPRGGLPLRYVSSHCMFPCYMFPHL